MDYLVLKAIHVMSLVSWFAAMFYLPRLFVYHAENRDNAGFVSVAKVMEKKLFNYIGLPAFAATVITGVVMIVMNPSVFSGGGWMHAKLTLVAVLIAWFFHAGSLRKQLENDRCDKSGRYFRIYNEIPTIFLIVIVLLAVAKPF
ncbi:MAG: protoporphyrinogen oxidase HemJ [Campylobacterales bacterium]